MNVFILDKLSHPLDGLIFRFVLLVVIAVMATLLALFASSVFQSFWYGLLCGLGLGVLLLLALCVVRAVATDRLRRAEQESGGAWA